MEKLIRALHALDYVVGALTIAYGLYAGKPLLLGLGVAGLALARMNIADRLSQRFKRLLARKQKVALPLDAEAIPGSTFTDSATSPKSYSGMRLTLGNSVTSSSRHSLLTSEKPLNHAQRLDLTK